MLKTRDADFGKLFKIYADFEDDMENNKENAFKLANFIAYKAIRNDRYSHYNFQYQYLPNETYEAHCDCTDDENSFGLSVWTEKGAKSYNNTGLIVKVKIKYEDVGRLVHNSNKIRCSKIEILE